ncbi:spore wall maturation protein Dit1p [[Candida] jaroonii]|uniref:Spore wall maturation protein Dit1p n=1 Tax=[Candida] jaroonii TaxID=467808 RepID=A0ACA9YAW1_9ASCO|nr:spore wall maturation protein Dit1p [[Candida] jaroonii]
MNFGGLPIANAASELSSSGSSTTSLSSEFSESNEETFFEKVVLLYFRDAQCNLVNYRVYHNFNLDITQFEKALKHAVINKSSISTETYFGKTMDITEKHHEGKGTVGLVTKPLEPTQLNLFMVNILLNKSHNIHLSRPLKIDSDFDLPSHTAGLIVEIFEKMLKNTSTHDQWQNGGKDFLMERVEYFTQRNLKVECVLPAFPCKSSNMKKVHGWLPDKGEEMALRKICDFVTAVRKIYIPGIVVWIVSDGHVFSDCIGVDDLMVNDFGFELKKMYKKIVKDYDQKVDHKYDVIPRKDSKRFIEEIDEKLSFQHGYRVGATVGYEEGVSQAKAIWGNTFGYGYDRYCTEDSKVNTSGLENLNPQTQPTDAESGKEGEDQASIEINIQKLKLNAKHDETDDMIRFASLTDIFSIHDTYVKVPDLSDIQVPHHVETEIDYESEICRKLLTASCDTDSGQLKNDVNTPNHPRLALYRGFAKFMEEDLATHPTILKSSKKKHKKIVSKVAFEMIKRNDAYSNLVELIFPMHLRFSIHAHNNRGPKFGIKLLSSDECKVIKSLDECISPNYDDLLHIPTPWHNTILQYEGQKNYFITKAHIIYDAFRNGSYSGFWDQEKRQFFVKKEEKLQY